MRASASASMTAPRRRCSIDRQLWASPDSSSHPLPRAASAAESHAAAVSSRRSTQTRASNA